jgi:hypothetical protein
MVQPFVADPGVDPGSIRSSAANGRAEPQISMATAIIRVFIDASDP